MHTPVEYTGVTRAVTNGLPGKPRRLYFIREAAFHVIAQGARMAPGNRGFKGFRNDVVVHQEIANVGNAEGQLITPSVLGSRLHAAMASGYAIQVTLLLLDLSTCSFED